MKRITLVLLVLLLFLLGMLRGAKAVQGANALLLEATNGAITPQELKAFKDFIAGIPVPTNNIHNAMVYGSGGTSADALGRLYEVSGDRELLDQMLAFTDAMLAARNDPKTGVVVWTGQRELIWPNAQAGNGRPTNFSTENGDVVGHIANAARLILQKKLWGLKVPDANPNGFGATYHERAVRYVHEMDRTIDGFILKWMVRP